VLSNERGFTLVELIAVLIVLAVITTVVVIKFNLFTGSATQQMIDHSIGELNNREKMVWTNLKLSFYEGEIDVEVQRIMNEKYMDLGNGTQVKDGVIYLLVDRHLRYGADNNPRGALGPQRRIHGNSCYYW